MNLLWIYSGNFTITMSLILFFNCAESIVLLVVQFLAFILEFLMFGK